MTCSSKGIAPSPPAIGLPVRRRGSTGPMSQPLTVVLTAAKALRRSSGASANSRWYVIWLTPFAAVARPLPMGETCRQLMVPRVQQTLARRPSQACRCTACWGRGGSWTWCVVCVTVVEGTARAHTTPVPNGPGFTGPRPKVARRPSPQAGHPKYRNHNRNRLLPQWESNS